MLAVKANQPTLRAEAEIVFAAAAVVETHVDLDCSGGFPLAKARGEWDGLCRCPGSLRGGEFFR